MPDDPEHRAFHTRNPDAVTFRQDDEQQWMDIRLPIASTGEVRNEGDEPLTRAELSGMAEQINTGRVGVFPEHGQSDLIDFTGYSQFEKLGYWTDAAVEGEAAEDGADILYATARVLDPEPLPSQTGRFREALSILREQAAAGVPITTSIGWREDETAPGGNDLLEVSIAGLQADPRTGTEGGEALIARAAVDAGADPTALVETVRAAVADTEDTHDMTDEDTETEPDEEQREDEEEEDETMSAEEFRAEMLDLQRRQMETLEALAESVREDDDDEEEQADDEDDEDEDEEQSADGDEERSTDDGEPSELEQRLADLEEELAAVRSGETAIDTPDEPEGDDAEQRDADDGEPADEQRTTDDDTDPAEKPAWAR